MTENEKMLAGQLYDPSDSELSRLRVKARRLARRYNLTDEDECEKQREILKELLPNSPEIPGLQAPVYFDYGCNTYFGKRCGTNFNFTCLDVCPVHIGDNVVIGAGSVVTKDIPGNVLAAGNPCRVIREITEEDRKYYFKKRRIDEEIFEDMRQKR